MTSLKLDTPLLAEKYDEVSNVQFDNGSILIEKLGLKEEDSVLDIGCGTGRLARQISEIVGSRGKVAGIDPLPLRIEVAKKKINNKNVSFRVAEGDDLGIFADNSFDHVLLSSVFHWIVKKEATLAEIFRKLKPDGKLGITTWDRDLPSYCKLTTDIVLSREPFAEEVNISEDPMTKHAVTRFELKELLKESGFRNISLDIRKTRRYYQNSSEIVDLVTSSCFGNYLLHVPEHLRKKALADITTELEKGRDKKGIEFTGNTVFAIAQK